MSDLLTEQLELQRQADLFVEELGLMPMLAELGDPVRVGSSAMGLMVRRDIDITIICETLDDQTFERFAAVGARLMVRRDRILSVRFRNDAGTWNADPASYPDGLYLGVAGKSGRGDDWTMDIWAVDQPERQPDLGHIRTLLPRLTDASRSTILTIKRALAAEPDDGRGRIASARVYEAVMDFGVADLRQFREWLSTRQ